MSTAAQREITYYAGLIVAALILIAVALS